VQAVFLPLFNYGLYFTWWDRWCGTEDPEYLRYGDERFAASVRREAPTRHRWSASW
jgi:sterol desaturase/sphingolipid hydroxylase (fatty acid hydroxylase superfamily)